jgi:biopolymer transport protein TolR
MGMSVGSKQGVQATINMTPMIDVLLVLIIIFMVITPTVSVGLTAKLPEASTDTAKPAAPTNDIVVTVQSGNTVLLNQEPVPIDELGGRLSRLFYNHNSHVLFVRGDKDLDFAQVATVIDIARGVGLDHVALMTN